MEIPEELLRGIYAYGFEKPSAIQQRAIKPTMLGRDLIAQAQSGTVSFLFALCCVVLTYYLVTREWKFAFNSIAVSLVVCSLGEGMTIVKKHHLSSPKRVTLVV